MVSRPPSAIVPVDGILTFRSALTMHNVSMTPMLSLRSSLLAGGTLALGEAYMTSADRRARPCPCAQHWKTEMWLYPRVSLLLVELELTAQDFR